MVFIFFDAEICVFSIFFVLFFIRSSRVRTGFGVSGIGATLVRWGFEDVGAVFVYFDGVVVFGLVGSRSLCVLRRVDG